MPRSLSRPLLVIVITCFGIGCAQAGGFAPVKRGGGPPDHAPAWGHRKKAAQEPGLRFRSDLGVHVVVDRPGYYFHDGLFLRVAGDSWMASVSLGGPWKPYARASLPPGLRKSGKGKAKGKDKAARGKRGRGPAKMR